MSSRQKGLRARDCEKRRAEMMPLSEFPLHKQCEIAWAVAQPRPPSRWLEFDVDGMPLVAITSRAWWEWHWQRGRDPYEKRENIAPWVRRTVIERDGYVCQLCGGDVAPDDVHLDHIVPWADGGPDTVDNLQVTHSACNQAKGVGRVGEGR